MVIKLAAAPRVRVEDDAMGTGWRRVAVEGLSTSEQLRREHSDAYDRAVDHPLVRAVRDGTCSTETFDRLLVINSFFLRTYRRFLQVMGTLAPDPRSSALLFEGLRGVDVELARTASHAEETGLRLDVAPSARSEDYASYVMASVGEGWWRGLAVAFACETVFHHAWRSVEATDTEDSTRALFLLSWGPDSNRFVHGLVTEMDRLSWTPELSKVVGHVAVLEMASWDEAITPADPAD
jgi:thiaminase